MTDFVCLLRCILQVFCAHLTKGWARTNLRKLGYARNHDENHTIMCVPVSCA